MSQRDGFVGGFLIGTVVGGLVGGIMGALIASGRTAESETSEASLLNSNPSEAKLPKGKKRQLAGEERIEGARRSLEDKIAQLNAAIDEVRTQLGPVNGNASEIGKERSPSKDI